MRYRVGPVLLASLGVAVVTCTAGLLGAVQKQLVGGDSVGDSLQPGLLSPSETPPTSKSAKLFLESPLGGLQFLLVASAQATEKPGEKPGGPPPLVVDKAAPLLLDSPAKGKDPADAPKWPVADNTACYVCHDNYQQEPLAAEHAKEDVGCMKCHGKSFDHRNDEDNVTPPDIMYAPEKIAANCRECHHSHDVSATEVIARWQERCPAKTDPKQIVCTDCHGQHRLKLRTVWWDKKTRRLIIRQGDQRIKTAPDLTKPPLP